MPDSHRAMTGDRNKSPDATSGFSLRRWSQRKLAAARETQEAPAAAAVPPVAPTAMSSVPEAPAIADVNATALPSIESLTTESDFTPFMRPEVDRGLQHKALRKLFADPRFNVMDGLDVYIDDYSKPDPISAEMVAGLAQARYLFDPPATRVDEHGFVVDVPPPAEPSAPAHASGHALPDSLPEANSDAPSPDAVASPEPAAALSPAAAPVEFEATASPADAAKPSDATDPK